MKNKVVFVAAKRTPFGAFGGSLKKMSATDLAVYASKETLKQSGLEAKDIDHVIYGNVAQTSADAAYLARHVGLKIGLPIPVPAVTVNRLCGSGFESIVQGARLIQTQEAQAVLVGGAESMSQAPYVVRDARFGLRLNHAEFEDSLTAALFDTHVKLPMALTAEKLAQKYQISRNECDAFAYLSQKNATEAQRSRALQDEIAPLELDIKGKKTLLDKDEHVRPEANMESMAKLKPVFLKEGVVTAANASGMVDGACSLIITSEKFAKDKGLKILGEYVEQAVVGCEPETMGIGPVEACRYLFKKTQLQNQDISLFEINEAFAAQVLAVQRELKFPEEKLNSQGGAIAIGHPLGASGARITAHLLYQLQKQGGGFGLGTACIGGGQGIAVLVKV